MVSQRICEAAFEALRQDTAGIRIREQRNARNLLISSASRSSTPVDAQTRNLSTTLSDASEVLQPSALHQEIYTSDSGTAFIPDKMKKTLVNLRAGSIVRPGTLADLQAFVRYASQNKLKYTIRATGTWPFGGAVAINRDIVLDLSYLDFKHLYDEDHVMVAGPGVIFAKARKWLKKRGFGLRQEITNPHSGTICGWIATGGLGLGAYKYGHVRESVAALLFLTPAGEWQTVMPDEILFEQIFSSEGQLGILAGVILRVRQLEYATKPFAFSFTDVEGAQQFMQMLDTWKLSPTTVLYYDAAYIQTTRDLETEKLAQSMQKAIAGGDEHQINRVRDKQSVCAQLQSVQHAVVLEFDARSDYERALKHPPFSAPGERRRYQHLTYHRLSVDLAHLLWEHRYAPVAMKPKGPTMLVSECILPLDKFPAYMDFVSVAVSSWTRNRVKTEAHLINPNEILIQSILLADTGLRRHKLYLGLVPFMSQAALHFGGRTYGTGLWNLPFLREMEKKAGVKKSRALRASKRKLDPAGLLNHGKFINSHGRKLALRIFKGVSPIVMRLAMHLLTEGRRSKKTFSLYPLGWLLWKGSKFVMPVVVPPERKAKRHAILEMTAPCAECDSCERVCPTSDVFGAYGPATPITRRKTANRVAAGMEISQEEALGFLACTRCDNCTRVCPTDIPLTDLFDLVEKDASFKAALNMKRRKKEKFVQRFWQIMKESPLYVEHTQAQQKQDKSHLEHGLKIIYPRGFAYAKLHIDPETCIRCGMCADENACTYNARVGAPREIPTLLDQNCALCNACINACPQNKVIQEERDYLDKMIDNALDLDEKRFWNKKQHALRDTTTIQRTTELTEMSDIYVTEEIIMEIDKEASTGQIPVSGMGQGDKHRGIGFDSERFSHFHIVGPAQNRLHEGDPDEELSVILGKRHRFCRFDDEGNMHNPPYPKIRLKTPILYNIMQLESNGRVELALIKVAEAQQTLVTIKLNKLLEHYDFLRERGGYRELPPVIIPRVDHELIHHLIINPNTGREFLQDLWRMPMFALTFHPEMRRTIQYIRDSVTAQNLPMPLLCGYLEISEYDMIGREQLLPEIRERIKNFLDAGVDVLHIHGLRNKDNYFVTSKAVRSCHHYLMEKGRRHEVSLIASGGIRLASDSQKTIQRGVEATLMDFSALLALDPYAYKALVSAQTSTEKLLNLDIDWAVERLQNQMESRKVQILEVLGAAGFKDLKKTVGEEGRLIDFNRLEQRIQKQIFEQDGLIALYKKQNEALIQQENIATAHQKNFSQLKQALQPLRRPHDFYDLSETNQTVYQRDHVWPGTLIETLGRMASGDNAMAFLKNVKSTGLLGDGFDVMKILYRRDPDNIPEAELNEISTAVALDKGLILQAPWMFGGKSVGSIGLDTWRAHVIAARELKSQYDTGEGGYPTSFFLNRKGEPIFFREPEMQQMKSAFSHGSYYTTEKIRAALDEIDMTRESAPNAHATLDGFPQSQPFLFYTVISEEDEAHVSTELKTGLFGVTKETIRKAKRVVIAYSQGAKMGIGGHILAQKVNKLVSYLRGVEGLEALNLEKIQALADKIESIEKRAEHPMREIARENMPAILNAQDSGEILPELKEALWHIQQRAYELEQEKALDPIELEQILSLCEAVVQHSYSSIISPFPFHNCYSIEDVKAFIDIVRMINPNAVVSVKVSPSVDIEFIAAGLARISRDNTQEAIDARNRRMAAEAGELSTALAEYASKYGMKIEIWLDGPRGGTGASPNIIKGQMGMHMEYAIPLIHHRLAKDGLRNHVSFFASGGIRTYEDVIKAVALGADGVIWGTAPLVAIGCDRNRNCHDGCSRGIATSNLIMQNLRDVEMNARQIINAFQIMQMQVIRALAGLGLRDIRQLRGRFDKIQWLGLKERVDFELRQEQEFRERRSEVEAELHATGQTNCGVAAAIGTEPIPSYILDRALYAMKNRGMDGVGVGKSLCFPEQPDAYAYRIMVKGVLQQEIEESILQENGRSWQEDLLRRRAREQVIKYREQLAVHIRDVWLKPYFEFSAATDPAEIREPYKSDEAGIERDYREFGNPNTDPGDIFRFFVRVKKQVLEAFILQDLLVKPRWAYIREYFPDVTAESCAGNARFMRKAEDLYVFDHTLRLSELLYVQQPQQDAWLRFADQSSLKGARLGETALQPGNISLQGPDYLQALLEFGKRFPVAENPAAWFKRDQRLAAVMSAGKNFGVWKTAGREIPWETPAAPNNIIHVRLATGSVVEQMNSHPFGKLHTALTHNGETTNYETLRQRVEQFGLTPLASTDTEVASLKFHLLADELEYPDWALFESFSPTTGDDAALLPESLREKLDEVQRVEFSSSPDGPYQYLCLRHVPEQRFTERVDLKDPADLRPSTTAIWCDRSGERPKIFSLISSEEQAIRVMLRLLDKEGLIEGAEPDSTFVSNGMINRFHFREDGVINDVTFLDRYGTRMDIPHPGEHYSVGQNALIRPENAAEYLSQLNQKPQQVRQWLQRQIPDLGFADYRWLLHQWTASATAETAGSVLHSLTALFNNLRSQKTGSKARGSLIGITAHAIENFLERLPDLDRASWQVYRHGDGESPKCENPQNSILLVEGTGFEPEGTDPEQCMAAFLGQAYDRGWRRFILYKVNGQRLLSSAVMGRRDTDDVEIDIYGTPGEYAGAFMQGGRVSVHGNAQNFAGMCMHHGALQVFGHAGKVCGYGSKGGDVYIFGDVVDRSWTNSVNDSRGQELRVHILGSASKYAGESLMGGKFFFGGMYFDEHSRLRLQDRPYRGTKLMGGAARGEMLFFDPQDRLLPEQYAHGKLADIEPENWPAWQKMVVDTLQLAGIEIDERDGIAHFEVDEKAVAIAPENFKLVIPKGGLKGYESH